ncbi:hypothetical protein B0H13DRAFT_2022025, partial [Mycena leptocephala]
MARHACSGGTITMAVLSISISLPISSSTLRRRLGSRSSLAVHSPSVISNLRLRFASFCLPFLVFFPYLMPFLLLS